MPNTKSISLEDRIGGLLTALTIACFSFWFMIGLAIHLIKQAIEGVGLTGWYDTVLGLGAATTICLGSSVAAVIMVIPEDEEKKAES